MIRSHYSTVAKMWRVHVLRSRAFVVSKASSRQTSTSPAALRSFLGGPALPAIPAINNDRHNRSGAVAAMAAFILALGSSTAGERTSHTEHKAHTAADVHGQTTKKWYFFKGLPESPDGVNNLLIFGGSVYPELSADVCKLLGMEAGKINLGTYADGECSVMIKETVMGKDVFVISPTHSNDSLMELLLIIAAARRASAERITAVIPFYGYSRQDRRFRREPIAAADVAHMLEAVGVDRVVTIDLHSGQIQGFFSPTTPVDHLTPMGVAAAYIGELVTEELKAYGGNTANTVNKNSHDRRKGDEPPAKIVVVAPQEGQVGRANAFKSRIEKYIESTPVGLAFIARSSTKKSDEEEEVHKHCIGDVKGALCIIVDDMIDTGDTLGNAVRLLKGAGARKIIAFATHGRFSGAGEARIAEIPGLERLVICNTLPHRTADGEIKDRPGSDKIRELSVAPLLAEAIYRVHKAMPFAELLTWKDPTIKGLPPRTMTHANLHDPSFSKGGSTTLPGSFGGDKVNR